MFTGPVITSTAWLSVNPQVGSPSILVITSSRSMPTRWAGVPSRGVTTLMRCFSSIWIWMPTPTKLPLRVAFEPRPLIRPDDAGEVIQGSHGAVAELMQDGGVGDVGWCARSRGADPRSARSCRPGPRSCCGRMRILMRASIDVGEESARRALGSFSRPGKAPSTRSVRGRHHLHGVRAPRDQQVAHRVLLLNVAARPPARARCAPCGRRCRLSFSRKSLPTGLNGGRSSIVLAFGLGLLAGAIVAESPRGASGV